MTLVSRAAAEAARGAGGVQALRLEAADGSDAGLSAEVAEEGGGAASFSAAPSPAAEPLLQWHNGVKVGVGGLARWSGADGGVYVGRGDKESGRSRSVWADFPASSWAPDELRSCLGGRCLYVSCEDEVPLARELIDHGKLWDCEPALDLGTWRAAWREAVALACTGSELALHAKRLVIHYPGSLGTFVRTIDLASLRASAKQDDLLPLPLPAETEPEARVRRAGWRRLTDVADEDGLLTFARAGEDAAMWLAVAGLNFLYAAGQRLLTTALPMRSVPTAAQERALQHVRRLVAASGLGPEWVEAQKWKDPSLGGVVDYWGHEVCKAYPLTLAQVKPSLPPAGVAARVDVLSLASPEVAAFLRDPNAVRLPEGEVPDPLPTAKVNVRSQYDYEKLIIALAQLGIVEPEIPSETVRHRGRPVYNGLFGVHKKWGTDEQGQPLRILRLIVNLVPTNALQRHCGLKSKRMGYAGLWPQLLLHDGELMVMYSEDQVGSFHCYRMPVAWRGFFVIGRTVDARCFGLASGKQVRPRVCVCPMGWLQAVDVIQDCHEALLTNPQPHGAGLDDELFVRMRAMLPPLKESAPRHWFSVYVDNFDQGKIVVADECLEAMNCPSAEQTAVREAYATAGLKRDAEKSACGVLTWETLGAELRGDEGLVGVSAKRRADVLSFLSFVVGADSVDERALLGLLGRLVFTLQFRRPLLATLGHVFSFVSHAQGVLTLPTSVCDELLCALAVLPLCWSDLRASLSGVVTATDASPTGGGACATIGLSAVGADHLADLDQGSGNAPTSDWLIVSDFDGMGGLHMALDLLRVRPLAFIAIENDKVARRVVRDRWPWVTHYPDITRVEEADVRQWREWWPGARRVLRAGGFPCQDLSNLNAKRDGPTGARSGLYQESLRLGDLLRKVGGWEVYELEENVFSMDADHIDFFNQAFGVQAVMIDAGDVSWTRRPRVYWPRNFPRPAGPDVILGKIEKNAQVLKLRSQVPELQHFLDDNTTRVVPCGSPWPTFTRPIRRDRPPPSPAGIETASSSALSRWRGDSFRLQPYQYEDKCLVRDSKGVRLLSANERNRMLGFLSGHTEIVRKLVDKKHADDVQKGLSGNTFSAIVVARLLAGLFLDLDSLDKGATDVIWDTWLVLEKEARAKARPQGWQATFQGPPPPARPVPGPRLTPEQRFVAHMLRRVDHRGSDVRLSTAAVFRPICWQRVTVLAEWWRWKVTQSYDWQQTQHINMLELGAFLNLLRTEGRNPELHDKRALRLLDSQVAIALLVKGRSSARHANSLLRRVAAVTVAMNAFPLYAWLASRLNPADGPSRWTRGHAAG